ncbi:MAG: stage II sporulation protein E [Bacillaceae bacterium]
MPRGQMIATNLNYSSSRESVGSGLARLNSKIGQALFSWETLLFVSAFLLGRAEILSNIIPFVIPFFGVIFLVHKQKALPVLVALLAGSLTLSIESFFLSIGGVFLFLLSQAILKKKVKRMSGILPFQVFFIVVTVHPLVLFLLTKTITVYDMLMVTIEASLSLILVMIFHHSIPLFMRKEKVNPLEIEEILCLIILIASVITGLNDWKIGGLEMQHIFTRYFVLIFGAVGGAMLGATVGVVTGLILSLGSVATLHQMSLLSFSGLLGGLLKDAKKIGVSFGLLVGTCLIGLYTSKEISIVVNLLESMMAIFLFWLTPRDFLNNLAKYLPGTQEREEEQQQYMRKLRDLTAQRVKQFSGVFSALASSFDYADKLDEEVKVGDDQAVDLFLSKVTEKTCHNCVRQEHCWVTNFDYTYDQLKKVTNAIENQTFKQNPYLKRDFEKACIKSKKLMQLMEREWPYFNANLSLRMKVHESRKLVAQQLSGVAQVMDNFSEEIKRERDSHQRQEEEILQSLRASGIELKSTDIYCLEKGNVDIEVVMASCQGLGISEKVIAPMLSNVIGETVIVLQEECGANYCRVLFGSAKKYVVETAVCTVAKNGDLTSGDAYSLMELGAGKYALAISDGMGNGDRAHLESTETLKLLKKILKSGIDEEVAIKSINSILALRTTDEIYATLDLAMIDLQDASAKFLKIGATPSFIKRGQNIMKIESSNLPIGIIEDLDLDTVTEQLKAGDILVMISDGIYEGPKFVENHEAWMKRKLKELKTDDPQEVADYILDSVIHSNDKIINDDMTIIVAKIKHNTPKWASIPLYSVGN